jgi:hypothetical protein
MRLLICHELCLRGERQRPEVVGKSERFQIDTGIAKLSRIERVAAVDVSQKLEQTLALPRHKRVAP